MEKSKIKPFIKVRKHQHASNGSSKRFISATFEHNAPLCNVRLKHQIQEADDGSIPPPPNHLLFAWKCKFHKLNLRSVLQQPPRPRSSHATRENLNVLPQKADHNEFVASDVFWALCDVSRFKLQRQSMQAGGVKVRRWVERATPPSK